MSREQQSVNTQDKRHEQLLIEYTEALLSGDLDTQDRLMAVAAGDPALENAFWNITEGYGTELLAEVERETQVSLQRDAQHVAFLAESHFAGAVLARPEDASAFHPSEEEEVEPLTVGIVATVLRSDLTRGNIPAPSVAEREDALVALRHLETSLEPLPERLTVKNVRGLLSRLIAQTQVVQNTAQRWLETQFHEAAAHLLVGQTATRLAAARRVRNRKEKASDGNDGTTQNQ